MSLTACERVAKPRASTMRSRSLNSAAGSEMLIRLTGRLAPRAATRAALLFNDAGVFWSIGFA